MHCMCCQMMAKTADAEEHLAESQALRANAERQAEQAVACLHGLTADAKDDGAAMELLRVIWMAQSSRSCGQSQACQEQLLSCCGSLRSFW